MSEKTVECQEAYSNPSCPYVTMINIHTNELTQVKDALIGKDLQSGLVAEIQRLKIFMKTAVFITGIALTAAVGLALKVLFGG